MKDSKHVYNIIFILVLLVIAIALVGLVFQNKTANTNSGSNTNNQNENPNPGNVIVPANTSPTVIIDKPFSIEITDQKMDMLKITNIGDQAYSLKRIAFSSCGSLIINVPLDIGKSYDFKAICGIKNNEYISVVYSNTDGSNQQTVTGQVKTS